MAETIRCFDCETEIPDDASLCGSCESHRVNGHTPRQAYDGAGLCHGSGPDGKNAERQAITRPRGVTEEEMTPWPIG